MFLLFREHFVVEFYRNTFALCFKVKRGTEIAPQERMQWNIITFKRQTRNQTFHCLGYYNIIQSTSGAESWSRTELQNLKHINRTFQSKISFDFRSCNTHQVIINFSPNPDHCLIEHDHTERIRVKWKKNFYSLRAVSSRRWRADQRWPDAKSSSWFWTSASWTGTAL